MRGREIHADGEISLFHQLYKHKLIQIDHYRYFLRYDQESNKIMKLIHYPDGKELIGAMLMGKWNGVRKDIYPNGDTRIGYWFDDKPIGKHEFVKLDRSTEIRDFGFEDFEQSFE